MKISYALTLALCFALCGCSSESSSQKVYVLPAEFFLTPSAERGSEGEIYITGTTNFPDETKIWVILGPKKAQADAFVQDGRFRSGALYRDGATPIAGNQHLEIMAYFNGAWQKQTVLSLLGEGGKNLHGSLFKLTDPDVVDSDKMLEFQVKLNLPPVTPQASFRSSMQISNISIGSVLMSSSMDRRTAANLTVC